MELELYQADAFASQPFAGNPARVVPLESWLTTPPCFSWHGNMPSPDVIPRPQGPGHYRLRWFTPDLEMDLRPRHAGGPWSWRTWNRP